MKTQDIWIPVAESLPPECVEVVTKIEDFRGVRNVAPLRREGRLWYTGNMYVYYTPTHWKPAA